MHHSTTMMYLVTIYAALTMEMVAYRVPKIPCSVVDHTYYHKQHGGCLHCEQCNPGEEQMDVKKWASKMPTKIFTIHGPTQCPTCTVCRKGYFNPGRAYKCRPCRNCTLHNQYEVQKCTSTSDAVCDGVLPEKRSKVIPKKDFSKNRVHSNNTHIVTVLVTVTFSLVVLFIIGVLAYKRCNQNRGMKEAEKGRIPELVSGMQETETTSFLDEDLNQTNAKEVSSASPTLLNGKNYTGGPVLENTKYRVIQGRKITRQLSSTIKENKRNDNDYRSSLQPSPSSTDDETKPLMDKTRSSQVERKRYKSESSYEKPKKEGKFQRQISEPGLNTDVEIDGQKRSINFGEKIDVKTMMLLAKSLCERHHYIHFARRMGLDDVTIYKIQYDHKDSGIEEISYQVLAELQKRQILVYKMDVTKPLYEMDLINLIEKIGYCQ